MGISKQISHTALMNNHKSELFAHNKIWKCDPSFYCSLRCLIVNTRTETVITKRREFAAGMSIQ